LPSDGIYKLFESSTGTQQLYWLSVDPFENTDLVEAGTAPTKVVEDLHFLADQIRQEPGEAEEFTIVDTNQE
jgi:hypothetical protein